MHVSATELNKRPGLYLDQATKEPVIIKKSGRSVIVMVAYDYYLKLEDAYWGEKAAKADEEEVIGTEETVKFLLSDE